MLQLLVFVVAGMVGIAALRMLLAGVAMLLGAAVRLGAAALVAAVVWLLLLLIA